MCVACPASQPAPGSSCTANNGTCFYAAGVQCTCTNGAWYCMSP
jgi:hypothetical protein